MAAGKPRKQLSGAQKRKLKREREEAAERAANPRAASPNLGPSDAPAGDIEAQATAQAERFKEIGPPPADGAQRVEWGNRIAAELAYEQLVAPAVRNSGERRLVLEAVRTLGMTAVKALYEERLKKLERKVYGARGKVTDAQHELEESE